MNSNWSDDTDKKKELKMFWEKKGLVHTCDFYGTGYAQDAFIDKLNDKVWRIYFSTRDANVVSFPYFIEVEPGNPAKILNKAEKPLFYLM